MIRVSRPAEPLPEAQAEPDAGTLATLGAGVVNRAMETLIRENPGQYLWGYHRYKAPRPIEPTDPTDTA